MTLKRKLEEELHITPPRPTKRLSMLDNTPQQWKEQRRKILKLSKQKLKTIVDAECNLLRSVLINNTYRKMKQELRNYECYSPPNWQYKPKPLFPNRSPTIAMEIDDIHEIPVRGNGHMMPVDDITSKALLPPAADLAEVLSDILSAEDSCEESDPNGDKILDMVVDKETVPSDCENKEMCNKMETNEQCSVNRCEESPSTLDSNVVVCSEQNTHSVPSDLSKNQDVDQIAKSIGEQDKPINYSLRDGEKECDTNADIHVGATRGHIEGKAINSNEENGNRSLETDREMGVKEGGVNNTMEDFVIGGKAIWTCDKYNYSFPSMSLMSLFPMSDLTNYSFLLPSQSIMASELSGINNVATELSNRNIVKGIMANSFSGTVVESDSVYKESKRGRCPRAQTGCTCKADNLQRANALKTTEHLIVPESSMTVSCELHSFINNRPICSKCSTNNSETSDGDNSCDSVISEGSDSSESSMNLECDESSWDCFHHFNMVIACS